MHERKQIHCRPYKEFFASAHTPCMSSIGARIKGLRKARALSQTALAEMCNISQPSLSLIEKGGDGGTNSLRGETLAYMCLALQVTPEYIMFGAGPGRDEELARAAAELLFILKNISSGERSMLMRVARSMLDDDHPPPSDRPADPLEERKH